ncbi:PH domain-containing protein [Antarcticibacterium arcticum]|uniref:PH domain-containing protein n=1 Tax=Antarcticibacterium arcticum TaxID=2585771 RepID=A0A5B8YIN7_9FLAO|nr:PH domain-containing protein [Antarcticibacterium arcticum]QED36483.1 PH domain-containing protein [Antarcticibacterium arcticum]
MKTEAFSTPQRQSVAGIALIFLTTLFKFLRSFWVLGVYLVLKTPSGPVLFYILLGLAVTAILLIIYSVLYYRNFLFHVDYKNEEFVLQKGVISTENIAISFDRIQQVYFKRSLLERIINVYSVIIDTAGSNNEEVKISAISKQDADALAAILTRVKNENIEGPLEGEEEVTADETWTYKLDVLALLKIGVSSNYARGLGLVLAFFMTLYNELNTFFKDYKEELGEYYETVPNVLDSVGIFSVLLILLLFVSIAITMLEVFIKYFGLKLTQTRDNMELEMGLKTNTKVSLQPRRVQLIEIVTNPVKKWLNLYEARIALASSENSLQKKKIKIPGLGAGEVIKVQKFLSGDLERSFMKIFRPHRIMLLRRIIIVLLPLLVSYLLFYWKEYIDFSIWLVLALGYLLLGITYQILKYRSLELEFSDEFLLKRQGVWNKREESVEIFKMQGLTVKQPVWYRKRNLVNVEFHTAGGDISFRAVKKTVTTYLNYILYKVESGNKRWM